MQSTPRRHCGRMAVEAGRLTGSAVCSMACISSRSSHHGVLLLGGSRPLPTAGFVFNPRESCIQTTRYCKWGLAPDRPVSGQCALGLVP
ncbi:hypothetical protein HYQ45_013814 [Verticillium longisporum]|uniref:Uncharacterized protein n=1 Tax=Verticillium longisporum TaxID=100787 RepID=A0A8I3AMD8_VERLO|nr:hypothetical protein HYQ45_013814 [Verticillium longisporum]